MPNFDLSPSPDMMPEVGGGPKEVAKAQMVPDASGAEDGSGLRFQHESWKARASSLGSRGQVYRDQLKAEKKAAAGGGAVDPNSTKQGANESGLDWLARVNSPSKVIQRHADADALNKFYSERPGAKVWKDRGKPSDASQGIKGSSFEDFGNGVSYEDGMLKGLKPEQESQARMEGIKAWRKKMGLKEGDPSNPAEFEQAWGEMNPDAQKEATGLGHSWMADSFRKAGQKTAKQTPSRIVQNSNPAPATPFATGSENGPQFTPPSTQDQSKPSAAMRSPMPVTPFSFGRSMVSG